MKKTVETELKSCSSVLRQNCSTTLSPLSFVTAANLKRIAKEGDRSKKVGILGVVEEQNGSITTKNIYKILEWLVEKPEIICSGATGKRIDGASRPYIFSVRSTDIDPQIMRKASD